MPDPTGHGVLIPSNLIGFGGALPYSLESFDNLAANATVTLGPFAAASQPVFDVYGYVVTGQAAGTIVATLQPQISVNGTWRNYGAAYSLIEAEVFQLPNGTPIVLMGTLVQWVLTALFATTTLELVITSR